jgi:hypothetical protein
MVSLGNVSQSFLILRTKRDNTKVKTREISSKKLVN